MSSVSPLSEKRRLRRHQLSTRIQIIDRGRRTPVGQLVNIHQEGLLILGTPLGLHATREITLVLPNSVNLQRQFDLGVECLWCQPVADGDLHWSGCGIIDKSDIATACIHSLLAMQSE